MTVTKLCVKVKITNDKKVGLHGEVPREVITPIMSLRKLNIRNNVLLTNATRQTLSTHGNTYERSMDFVIY